MEVKFILHATYVTYVTCYNLETYPGVMSTAKSVDTGQKKTSKWRKQRMRLLSYQVTKDDSTKSSEIFFILLGIWAIYHVADCKSAGHTYERTFNVRTYKQTNKQTNKQT